MTLLEKTYIDLRQNGLVRNAEQFSMHYLNKSRSWYAVQMHEGRDFSAAAAIQCLQTIRLLKVDRVNLNAAQRNLLVNVEQLLSDHLLDRYAVLEIA